MNPMLLAALLQGLLILFFLFLGWLRPRVRQPLLPPQTVLNLATGITLFGFRLALMGGLMEWAASLPYTRPLNLDALANPWLQLTVAFVLQDFARYWLHYAHHRVPFLWRFHRVHHSSEVLDASAGLRMHLVDFIQLNLVPVVCFGLLCSCQTFPSWVWLAMATIVNGMDAFQHANIRMDLRHPVARWWNTLFVSPCFHSWHHASDWRKYDGNYGQTLSVWDHIFGTSVEEDYACTELGLPEHQQLEESLLGLQLLRPRRRPEAATPARPTDVAAAADPR